jgi:hypothetical protein
MNYATGIVSRKLKNHQDMGLKKYLAHHRMGQQRSPLIIYLKIAYVTGHKLQFKL